MTSRRQQAVDPAPAPLETADPMAGAATEAIGGPLGRFAALSRRGWAGAASVLVALGSVTVALGVAQKSHCVKHGWTDPAMYWRACFSDLPQAWTNPVFAGGRLPYLEGIAMQEPPLNGVLMWLVGLVTPGAETAAGQQAWYFGLWALAAMLLLAGAIAAVAWARPADAWRASHLALSPVIVTTALISPDLLGVLLVTVGCAAYLRGRLGLAGLMLGLALLSGSYAVLVLLGVVMVAARAGRLAEGLGVLTTAIASAVVAALPLAMLGPAHDRWDLRPRVGNVLSGYTLWEKERVGYGSTWKILQPLLGELRPEHLTVIGWLGFVWAVLIGAIVAFGLRRQVGLGPVVLAMIATAMITGRSLPVQQALWLLPFIALAVVPWRDHLIWAGAEVAHFVAVWMVVPFQRVPDKALDPGWYGLFALLRLAAIGYLVWSAIQHAPDQTPAAEDAPLAEDRHDEFLDAAPRGFGTA